MLITDSEKQSIMAALMIARRYVLRNMEQLATITFALNILNKDAK